MYEAEQYRIVDKNTRHLQKLHLDNINFNKTNIFKLQSNSFMTYNFEQKLFSLPNDNKKLICRTFLLNSTEIKIWSFIYSNYLYVFKKYLKNCCLLWWNYCCIIINRKSKTVRFCLISHVKGGGRVRVTERTKPIIY